MRTLLLALMLALWLATPAIASDEVRVGGSCGAGAQSQLRMRSDGGSIRVVHALARDLDYVRDHASIPPVPNCVVARYAVQDGKLTSID